MEFFVSAREKCTHKLDFDYCTKNWKTIPNETILAWNQFEHESFREKLIAGIKTIVEDERSPVPQEVPETILQILKDESFHSITMLDVLNKGEQLIVGNNERVNNVVKLLAAYWMESSHLTQILLSFVREPDSARKMANMKHYYGIIFTMGEKLVEQKIFIRFLLTKIDTVFRILVERDDARYLSGVYPMSIASLIDRIYVRFCTGVYRNFLPGTDEFEADNPFLGFMESLLDLSKRNFRIQRLLSSILVELNVPAQERILSSWFAVAPETTIQSDVPFFPFSNYYVKSSYEKTLLCTIPFDSSPNHSTKFWTNWAGFVTSEPERIPEVWDKFMESFWELALNVTNSDSLKTPAFAFVGLAAAIKLRIGDIPLQRVMQVTRAVDKITRLMESVDIHLLHIGWALAHALFDLDHAQNEAKTGKSISRQPIFDCDADIFLRLVGFYEGKSPEEIRPPQPPESLQVAPVLEVPQASGRRDGQESHDEGSDERVRRLRTAGLIPTSMLDVYQILVGDTKGRNDSETEALKQVAVLHIPMLMMAGAPAESTHLETVGKILFEWGKDKDLDDFLSLAIYELGIAYPELISKTLVKIIFSNNQGIGEKVLTLKNTEKILTFCGSSRCVSCFALYGPEKKDEMRKFVTRMEPAFFNKYDFHCNRHSACITCGPRQNVGPPASEEALIIRLANEMLLERGDVTEASSFAQSTTSVDATGTSPAPPVPRRASPPTRRWGRRKETPEVVAVKKKTLHTSMWTAFHSRLVAESDSFLNEKVLSTGVQTHFLIQLLEFLRNVLMSYTGLSYFVQNIPKEAFQLIQIYGDHPNTNARKTVWSVLTELVMNMHITPDLSLVEEDREPNRLDLFNSYLAKEKDPELLKAIHQIRAMYRYQKGQHLKAIGQPYK